MNNRADSISNRALRVCALAGALAFAIVPIAANAQVRPDTGQILQEMKKAPEPAPSLNNAQQAVPKAPGVKAPTSGIHTGKPMNVTGYKITGNTMFRSSELLAPIRQRTGSLMLADLDAVAQVVSSYYRDHGYWVARAYIPEQEILGGVVEIAVLEGRFENIEVDNSSDVLDKRVTRTLQMPICGGNTNCEGKVIESRSLERGLLLLSDLPGVVIKSDLHAGSAIGTADLGVVLSPGSKYVGSIEANNYGNKYTGTYRGTAAFGVNNPFNIGDQIYLQAVGSGDMLYGGVTYQAPGGYNGTTLGTHASTMDYSLGDRFEVLDASGIAHTVGFDLTHSFIRSTRSNLQSRFTYNFNRLQDEVRQQGQTNERTLHEVSLTMSGDYADSLLFTRGISGGSLTFTAGHLALDDYNSKGLDAISAKTAGVFAKLNFSLYRVQAMPKSLSLYTSIEGIYGFGNLDSYEKFGIGGPGGVRGYPVGEASGDRGAVGTVELRWNAPMRVLWGGLEIKAFYDYGYLRVNADPWTAEENTRNPRAAGVGVSWAHETGVTLKAVFAAKSGEAFRSEPDRSSLIWGSIGYRF